MKLTLSGIKMQAVAIVLKTANFHHKILGYTVVIIDYLSL